MRVLTIITFLFLLSGSVIANDYYVNPTGNDTSGNGSINSPWKTLKHAVGSVSANQGHTIHLSSGIFIESGPINIPAGINISGAGRDQTVIKAQSSFFYNPTTPGYEYEKYLIRLFEYNPTQGNQTLKNFKIDGDNKQLHGGIYVKFRNNVTIEGLEVTGTNFNGIWLFDVKDSKIIDTRFINCSWGSEGYSVGALNLGNVERVLIDNVYIDEDTGYGIKAIGPSGYNNVIELRILNSHITVNPYGLWNNGQAPNIAIELWQVDLVNCEIANTYVDNTISLINSNANPSTGVQTIRVHHNILDMEARANGAGYGIELTIHDAEVDHNYIHKGSYGIANWDNPMENWEIHHNTFYAISGNYPGEVLRSQWSGLHNVNFYNNTIEFDSDKTTSVIGLYGGTSENITLKNNLIIDSNPTVHNYYPSSFIHLENNAALSQLTVQNNLFKDLPIGSVSGTYNDNISNMDPDFTKGGLRPSPYYVPNASSPLVDAGLNIGQAFEGSAPDIGAFEYSGGAPPANVAPTVNLTSPANNASYTQGQTITISATASDSDGSVVKVEFFNGAAKLGEDLSSPYSFAWNNPTVGSHSLTAKATDNKGLATTSGTSNVTVAAPANVAPTVNLTSPTNNASYTQGQAITISATASDSDGSIAKVEFFDGTAKLGEDLSSPYSFEWNNATKGDHGLTAKATDDKGLATTSGTINITVATPANVAPTVNLTSPTNNASYTQGQTITISATASDSDGSIAKVEFFNGTDNLGEDLSSPYSFEWNSATVGSHSLTVKATDDKGLTTTSGTINITVVAPANVAPTVNLTSPTSNASYTEGQVITINATASDSDGSITKVEFFNGTDNLGEDLSSPYSFEWYDATVGNHSLTVKATDDKGLATISETINITVTAPTNVAPTVNLTSPTNNVSYTQGQAITISATASDSDGSIAKVEFFKGTDKLGEDLSSPYSFVWNNATVGSHSLTVKATDNSGEATISVPVNIIITSRTSNGFTLGLDAIDAELTGIMTRGQDPQALENTYFHIPKGSGKNYYIPPSALAIFRFELPEKGNYEMWIRVKSQDYNNRSFYVYDGNGKWYEWNAGINDNWKWVKVKEVTTNNVVRFPFKKGENAFAMGWLHENVLIDHIYITNDANFDPNQTIRTDQITDTEDEFQDNNDMILYPNPATDHFTIKYSLPPSNNTDNSSVFITDLNSRQIIKQPIASNPGSNTLEINTSDMKKGIYLVTIKSGNISLRKRLIVNK